MCLYPKLINNRKYVANKKNGGNIPPIPDERVKIVTASCGKCMECRKQKMREWQVRLSEELRTQELPAWFVTMTYSEKSLQELDNQIEYEHKKIKRKLYKEKKLAGHQRNKENYLEGYNRDNEIARLSVRRFTERWRKKFGKTVRHWIVTELGTNKTERLHLHGIVWCQNKADIKERWQYGGVYIGEWCNNETIAYIVKYLNKSDKIHKEYIPKMFVSQGIGRKYLNRKDKELNKYKEGGGTDELYRTRDGLKLALPIYYRNKIYTENEREKLWIEKLDKEERYILGRKVKNEEDYYKTLEEARKVNKTLGYGDNKIDWNRKEYEQTRRNLKRLKRIKKLYG
jgi:hypothetical protein